MLLWFVHASDNENLWVILGLEAKTIVNYIHFGISEQQYKVYTTVICRKNVYKW